MSLTSAQRVTPGRKLILLGLAIHADRETGISFPAVARVAEFACMDRRSARRLLSQLIKLDLVVAETLRTGGRRNTTHYRLMIPPSFASNGTGSPPEAGQISLDKESRISPRNPDNLSKSHQDWDIESAFGGPNAHVESSFPELKTGDTRTLCPKNEDPESSEPVIEPSKKVSKRGSESRVHAHARAPAGEFISTRFSNDWEFSEERRAVASNLGLDPDAVFGVFSAYWRSRCGDEALSADWDASWQLWCHREVARNQRRQTAGPQRAQRPRPETMAEKFRRLAEEYDPTPPKVLQ
jgi:hypothetical protein